MATANSKEAYILYIFPFSLYSMMTRFTANLGLKTDTAGTGPRIGLKLVNLHKQEQFTEEYLAINPTGQVSNLAATLRYYLAGQKAMRLTLCPKGSLADRPGL